MIWLFAIAGIMAVVGIILMVAFPSVRTLISSIGAIVILLFSTINVFITLDHANERRVLERIKADNDYWFRVMDRLGTDPIYNDMHQAIYGDTVPPHVHAMFSVMMQIVGALIFSHEVNITDVYGPWYEAISKWVGHPDFPTYWANNKDDYNSKHNAYIEEILRSKYGSVQDSIREGEEVGQ